MKVGRNDLCPCGSGKNYKDCCLTSPGPAELESDELTRRRVQRALDEFSNTIVRFIDDAYGSEAIHEAWDEFTLWDDAPESFLETPHAQLFLAWFHHRWRPDPADTLIEDESLHGLSPTQLFLQRKRECLDPLLRRYLEACAAAALSFYDILHTEPGGRIHVRDIFTGTEYSMVDDDASHPVKAGSILFAQLVPFEGTVVLEACSLVTFRPVNKIPLIQLRQEMTAEIGGSPTHTTLIEWDMEIREQYLQMLDQLMSPERPAIYNVDGEEIHPHRVTFAIDSAQMAFDALKELCGTRSAEELLEAADCGPDGELEHVQLDWTRPSNSTDANWDTIFLASIEITPSSIVAEVNSEERVEKLKQIVTERLGEHARHLLTESTLYQEEDELEDDGDEDDDLLEDEHGDDDTLKLDRDDQDSSQLTDLLSGERHSSISVTPELTARLNELMTSYYENWASEQLPALGGRTPLEMVNHPDGREMVEALILDIEISGREMHPPLDESIPRRMRERLGLAPRP